MAALISSSNRTDEDNNNKTLLKRVAPLCNSELNLRYFLDGIFCSNNTQYIGSPNFISSFLELVCPLAKNNDDYLA
jgi:hypothetical protein